MKNAQSIFERESNIIIFLSILKLKLKFYSQWIGCVDLELTDPFITFIIPWFYVAQFQI